MKRPQIIGLVGAAVGLGAGMAAQKAAIRRRRRNDPEGAERFGERRGVRSRTLHLPDGAALFIEEAGPESERAAVFIHGSALRTDSWHYQLSGLGDHRLVFFDIRGHGRSQPKGSNEFTIKSLAQDLLAVIEDCNLKECVFVGHSVGGAVALQLCFDRPDLLSSLIKGLVLVNTSHTRFTETTAGAAALAHAERIARRPLDFVGKQAPSVDLLRKLVRPTDGIFWTVSFSAFGPSASAKQIDFAYDMLAETPTDVIIDLIRSYRDFDATEELSGITVPALVIGGERDRITVKAASEYLAEHLPKAELKLLRGCGHMSMLERHREFNTMLEQFFDDVMGRPGKGARRKR